MLTKRKRIRLILFLVLLLPGIVAANQSLPPLFTTDWLADNMSNRNLVILDVRGEEDYAAGHISGSVNAPFTSWWVNKNGVLLELPEDYVLSELISACGIDNRSQVAIIQKTDTDFSRAEATRVAWTLHYAGITRVGVLNGGINQWIAEERALTTSIPDVVPSGYICSLKPELVVTKDYVSRNRWWPVLVDARIAEDFFGVAPLTFSSRPGHISGARSLPTPWIFTGEGMFRDKPELAAMARGVVGWQKHREIIVYCGAGGYAATWWYILSEVLGYRDVKIYDGSYEEWSADPDAPVKVYCWW